MVNNKINSYDEIINLLGIRLDDCDKILRNTIELKEMLNGGDEEDSLIKKMQERGVIIKKASALSEECHSINEFVGCLDDGERKSLLKELMGKMRKLLDEIALLDKENKSLIESRINEIALNLEKLQESKQLARSIDKNINDKPSFIDVCG